MIAERIAARFSMAGRRALVTGGSLSIGRAIAIAFAEAGADVAIQFAGGADAAVDRTGAADDVVREIQALGRRAVAIDVDFAEADAGRRCVAGAGSTLGAVDVLVVCASIQKRTPFVDVTAAEVARQTRVNFDATIELLQAALPAMAARGFGRVLTIGSINQTRPEPDLAVYAALKSAQTNLVINLARQYAPHGVTVNNLAPGLVATDRNRWRRETDFAAWQRLAREANPMQRAGLPDEIAGAALLLCSEAGRFVTGVDLAVDGGHHL